MCCMSVVWYFYCCCAVVLGRSCPFCFQRSAVVGASIAFDSSRHEVMRQRLYRTYCRYGVKIYAQVKTPTMRQELACLPTLVTTNTAVLLCGAVLLLIVIQPRFCAFFYQAIVLATLIELTATSCDVDACPHHAASKPVQYMTVDRELVSFRCQQCVALSQ